MATALRTTIKILNTVGGLDKEYTIADGLALPSKDDLILIDGTPCKVTEVAHAIHSNLNVPAYEVTLHVRPV